MQFLFVELNILQLLRSENLEHKQDSAVLAQGMNSVLWLKSVYMHGLYGLVESYRAQY